MKPGPRPLYRSLTFWCGVFILSSLVWAMWDSMSHSFELTAGRARFINHSGEVSILWFTGRPPTYGIVHHPLGGATQINPFPALNFGWPREDDEPWLSAWWVDLPHWLLILAVALPWMALCVRRDRRIRRAAADLLPPK